MDGELTVPRELHSCAMTRAIESFAMVEGGREYFSYNEKRKEQTNVAFNKDRKRD